MPILAPARRAARLGVVVGKDGTLGGQFVYVGRATRHHTAVISTDVPYADVITHDDNDVRFLGRKGCADGQTKPAQK